LKLSRLALAPGLVLGAAPALRAPAHAAETPWTPVDRQAPVLLTADEISQDGDIVTARGGVGVSRGDRLLLGDSISWNRATGTVTATGNVSLVEPGGNVVFADRAEITEDLRDGVKIGRAHV